MKGDVTMRIIITDSYRQMGREAANMVAGQLYLKPDSVLGLATGSTPARAYRRHENPLQGQDGPHRIIDPTNPSECQQ